MSDIYKEVIELQDELILNLVQENKKLKRIINTLLVITLSLIIACLVLI